MAKETKKTSEQTVQTASATVEATPAVVPSESKASSAPDEAVEKLKNDLEFFQSRTGELEREIADLQRLLKETKQGQKQAEKALEKAGVDREAPGLPVTAVRGQRGVRTVRTALK